MGKIAFISGVLFINFINLLVTGDSFEMILWEDVFSAPLVFDVDGIAFTLKTVHVYRELCINIWRVF